MQQITDSRKLAGNIDIAMSKRDKETFTFTRVNARLPTPLVARMDEARSRLRREGLAISYSSFVEIAVEELLGQRDLGSVLRRHGATARRS